MSIEGLKQQARRHEQEEEWQEALNQYQKALRELAKEEQTDIGLVNRVGDLFVRIGKLDDAVRHYDQAVELYREAFLPNNAIAVCKKILRSVPERHETYLKIGQIRAEQGFLPDARSHFLIYAERMQQAGDLDESFRALVEFCDLAPDEVDIRITVADQMAANERTEDAVAQLVIAYARLTQSGEADLAQGVEQKIRALDPDADVEAAFAASAEGGDGLDGDMAGEFGEIDLGGGIEAEPFEEEADDFAGVGGGFIVGTASESESSAGVAEAVGDDGAEVESEDEAFELPVMSFDDGVEDEGEEEAFELPMISLDDSDESFDSVPEEETELPTFDVVEDEEPLEVAHPVEAEPALEGVLREPVADSAPERADVPGADEPAAALEEALEEQAADERQPETQPSAVPGLSADEPPEPRPARDAPATMGVPDAAAPPVEKEPAKEEYVDLGAMILGGGDEKSTRMRVQYEEPTGDEEADFARMLSQFKDKVSENIDAGDVRAHYDLGTAYMEMGLLEEAIGAFQAALRASSVHLPTYELMGQTFIEMGQAEAAVRTLQRALQIKGDVEDDFVGIYYHLGRAFEMLDEKDSAVDCYDRVFALDINFADVTERLRELR